MALSKKEKQALVRGAYIDKLNMALEAHVFTYSDVVAALKRVNRGKPPVVRTVRP
jgi:ribosomal protein L20